ncbi:MAG: MFS transporter [Pseudomonadota bacterium]
MSATQHASPSGADARSLTVILAAGALVLALSFGVRTVFGGVLDPISQEFGWPRETFSLSLAIQNLVWGLAQPFFGMIADRFGDRRALWLGFFCYLAGMVLTVLGTTPMEMHMGAGVLVGAGVAGTAFGLVLAVVGRAAPDNKRSKYLGLVAAMGSAGQAIMPILAGWLTVAYGWQAMLVVMTILILPMAFCIPFLHVKSQPSAPGAPADATILEMLKRAFGYSSYNLLVIGFFVCGFHVAFIAVHFPAFVTEMCGDPALGLQALGVVGLANIFGSLMAGYLGDRFPKPYILSAIYALRSLVIFLFITLPITPTSVMIFAVTIGMLWLSTVPLTSGLVAGMFGPKYMATLYGFVFLSHQLGSFLGVWLGGRLYDIYNSYDIVWWAAIALGIASAIVHLPIRERPPEIAVPA